MKEIGKLLELLNEYEKEKNPKTEYKWFSSFYKPLCYGFKVPFQGWHDNGEDYSEEIATSRQYGFIKRLVEKDKIDFYTILKENGTFRKEFYAIENRKEYERLIMLLSVEDEPINFLISILK